MIEKKLESGRELVITPAPFADAREVYQAFVVAIKDVDMDEDKEIDVNFLKGMFCAALSDKRLEAAIWACLPRCKYQGHKIIKDTFEDVEAREDYLEICWLVAEENVRPFTKALMQKFSQISGQMKKFLA